MIRIVSFDTTGEFGGIALIEDGSIVEDLPLHAPDGYGHILFQHLDRLMARHAWCHASVRGYAAASGPGSFTGVRVGLAAAKGLAEAAGKKAAGISNLMAMASYGSAPLRAPFCDARRGEIYGALYNARLELEGHEVVLPFPAWRATLPPNAELLTPDPSIFSVQATITPRSLAAAVGLLAPPFLTDPAALDANYVRRSDAELKWTE